MTDMNADAHTNSITRIFPRLGETGTTREIIDLLDNPRVAMARYAFRPTDNVPAQLVSGSP